MEGGGNRRQALVLIRAAAKINWLDSAFRLNGRGRSEGGQRRKAATVRDKNYVFFWR